MNLPVAPLHYCALSLCWLVTLHTVARASKAGDTVTLPCEIHVDFEVMWFFLRPNNTLSIVMLTNVRADGVSLSPTTQFDARLRPVYNASLKRMTLWIQDVTSTDVGLYYCAKRVGNKFQIGNMSMVTLSSDQSATTLDEEDCWMVIGMELPGFIALIVAPLMSVLLSAGIILSCPLYNKHPKRRK